MCASRLMVFFGLCSTLFWWMTRMLNQTGPPSSGGRNHRTFLDANVFCRRSSRMLPRPKIAMRAFPLVNSSGFTVISSILSCLPK